MENAGKATGPLVRYIQACLAPLNVTLSNDAVRDRIKTKFQGMVKLGS